MHSINPQTKQAEMQFELPHQYLGRSVTAYWCGSGNGYSWMVV